MTNDVIVAALQWGPAVITLADKDKRILWCSSYASGYTSSDMIGRPLSTNVHTEDRDRFEHTMDRVLLKRSVLMGTIRIQIVNNHQTTLAFRMSTWPGSGLILLTWDSSRLFSLSEEERGETQKLTPTEKLILSKLGYKPASPKHLSKLVERQYNSHFRTCLSHLCNLGLAVRTSQGYALPPSVWTLPGGA